MGLEGPLDEEEEEEKPEQKSQNEEGEDEQVEYEFIKKKANDQGQTGSSIEKEDINSIKEKTKSTISRADAANQNKT